MSKEFSRTIFNYSYPEKIGVQLEPIGNDLPKLNSNLTVPSSMPVKKVIEYYCDKIDLSKYVLCGSKEIDPLRYVEFCLDSGLREDGQPVYMVVENELQIIVVYKVLYY